MTEDYATDDAHGETWTLTLGDSCERLAEVPDASVDLSIYSPPFASLFTYSPSFRDLGNSATREDFLAHYGFIIREVLRATRPGRLSAVHVQQLTTTKATHGVVGLTDFRGQVIAAHQAEGWIFHGEITVDKALADGTPVLTPSGWRNIEHLAVDDLVIDGNGNPTRVVATHPQAGDRDLYRVTLSDRSSVRCTGDHLWNVRGLGARYTSGRWQTVTTSDLAGATMSPGGRRRYEVPCVQPVAGVDADLPLDGYTLGALLGDGNVTQRSSVSICTQHEIVAGAPLPAGHTWRRQAGTDKGAGAVATYHVNGSEWHRNDVLTALRDLDVQGRRAWEKRVPARYLFAAPATRLAVLRGIMDTDGRISMRGGAVLRQTSEGLAEDVAYLVRSLGGVARVSRIAGPTYTYAGEVRYGRPQWSVNVNLDMCPFGLPAKAERWVDSRRVPRREIVRVERDGRGPATCITVAAEDGLFVTDDLIVTHNCPQAQAIRTKATSLMFATLERDSASVRPALADYVLLFRAPGDNVVRVKPEVSRDEWINWARPIWQGEPEDAVTETGHCGCWYGIRESDTLNVAVARVEADERHICPLQLGLIERAVRLWTNPGETVLSPFAGIGSEGYVAVKHGRRFVGCELKPSYWASAVTNLKAADMEVDSRLPLDV